MVVTSNSLNERPITKYLYGELREVMKKIDKSIFKELVEIRFGINKPLCLFFQNSLVFITKNGEFTDDYKSAFYTTKEMVEGSLQLMCENSIYAMSEKLKSGFLTLPGGHRAGICAHTVCEGGKIVSIRDISAISIRIAHQCIGFAEKIIDEITDGKHIKNTLVISPPRCGKTTLLRDIARLLGGGKFLFKTAIVDERSEIAAMYKGKAYNDVGFLTVVMDNCPKAEGILMLLRSMTPDVIITDEIGGDDDVYAIRNLINAGVKIICSCHGYDEEDASRRGRLGELIKQRIFEKIIILSAREGVWTIERVY